MEVSGNLHSWENSLRYPLHWKVGGPTAEEEKTNFPHLETNLGRPALNPSLYRLRLKDKLPYITELILAVPLDLAVVKGMNSGILQIIRTGRMIWAVYGLVRGITYSASLSLPQYNCNHCSATSCHTCPQAQNWGKAYKHGVYLFWSFRNLPHVWSRIFMKWKSLYAERIATDLQPA
jgi:hypothetical protein